MRLLPPLTPHATQQIRDISGTLHLLTYFGGQTVKTGKRRFYLTLTQAARSGHKQCYHFTMTGDFYTFASPYIIDNLAHVRL